LSYAGAKSALSLNGLIVVVDGMVILGFREISIATIEKRLQADRLELNSLLVILMARSNSPLRS